MSKCGETNKKHLCQWCRMITATGGWSFYGCTHEPYHGKWIAEIEDCPLEESERPRYCDSCKHFIGMGDWNLCCDLPHPEATCGFLCYDYTPACDKYEPKEEHHDP